MSGSSIISSVHIVDGILAVSIEPEMDSSLSVEELLAKPSCINYSRVHFLFME